MTTAFVLSGGASLGAVQVGMVEVVLEAGIEPDLIIGASVGSLNGAWLASHPGVEGARMLRDVWRSVRRRDIFPISPVRIVKGVAGRCDHVVSAAAMTRWLESRAPFNRLEDALIPLHAVATDLLAGSPVVLSRGELIPALLASSAIPGVFPPVEIDGRLLVDGGLAANTPVSQAIDLGADEVYLFPTVNDGPGGRPRGALGVSMQSVAHILGHASLSEIRACAGRCHLFVVRPPRQVGVAPFDFSHTEELFEQGRASAVAWMAERRPVAADL